MASAVGGRIRGPVAAGAGFALAGGGALALRKALGRVLARPGEIERSLTVGKPADELRRLLSDPESVSRIFAGRADATSAGDGAIHLRLHDPDGAGSLRFRPAPAARGTEVTLRLHLGGATKLVPKPLVTKALRRLKSLAETGEIPTLERNPSARAA